MLSKKHIIFTNLLIVLSLLAFGCQDNSTSPDEDNQEKNVETFAEEAYPDIEGEPVTFKGKNGEIKMLKKGDHYVTGGDILISKEQIEFLNESETVTLDFGSIMMYGPFAFSRNGNPTITRNDGSLYNNQRDALSSGDINGINLLYDAYCNQIGCN